VQTVAEFFLQESVIHAVLQLAYWILFIAMLSATIFSFVMLTARKLLIWAFLGGFGILELIILNWLKYKIYLYTVKFTFSWALADMLLLIIFRIT